MRIDEYGLPIIKDKDIPPMPEVKPYTKRYAVAIAFIDYTTKPQIPPHIVFVEANTETEAEDKSWYHYKQHIAEESATGDNWEYVISARELPKHS